MSKYQTKPKPIHLEMLERMEAPACISGRGPTTTDIEKVTCVRCQKSGTMARIRMRIHRNETTIAESRTAVDA